MGGKISSRAGIVIKYPNAVNLPESGAALPLPEHDALRWTNLVKKVQKESNVKLKIRPLFSHIDPKKLSALADLARAKDGRSHGAHVTPRFQNYLWVSFIGAQGTNATAKQDILRIAGECAAEINNWRGVERAYVRLEDKPAGLAQQANPIRLETVVASKQNVKHKCANHVHLDAAPTGVRAEGIWDYAGGDGTGQSFVDIEHSWYLKHVDLKKGGSEFAKFDGSNGGTMDVDKGHGTSVLGIVFGNQNSRGMTGIAPNISTATVISTWSDPEPLPTAEAVMLAAALHLKPAAAPAPVGGFVLDTNVVVLIELQAVVVGSDYNFPVEVYSETFAAIKALSDAGITVVEPAGNGSLADSGAAYSAVDLDSLEKFIPAADRPPGLKALYRPQTGASVSNPVASALLPFVDSGAIMVGMGRRVTNGQPPHWVCDQDSNFGSRVDCFAHGSKVCAPSYSSVTKPPTYDHVFDGTSAASAIIAGAALCLKGVAQNANPIIPLDAYQVRSILSDRNLGTKILGGATNKIGVMPDLAAILAAAVNTWAP